MWTFILCASEFKTDGSLEIEEADAVAGRIGVEGAEIVGGFDASFQEYLLESVSVKFYVTSSEIIPLRRFAQFFSLSLG
jgi:hypothetical protein